MVYEVTEVFTPSTTATLTFVERARINDRLVNSLRTPGMQIVVFGRSGCGKTTLLENKLRQTYDAHVTSRCVKTTTLEQLLLDAFDQLAPFYTESTERTRTKTVSGSIAATYKAIALSLGGSREEAVATTERRLLPPQLTPGTLARLLGEIQACWVVEDFHKVEGDERVKLAQIMKLFMDMAVQYRTVRIITIGAVGSARQVVECDAEMWNRVSEVEVQLMDTSELNEIMTKGESALNVAFSNEIRDQVAHFSNGLPAVCHQICLNMCFAAGIDLTQEETYEFTESDLASAVERWIEDSADSLRAQYDKATRPKRTRRFDNCRVVLHSLAAFSPDGATHHQLLAEVRRSASDYPSGNLTQYLQQLSSSEREFVLVKDDASGKFSFSSPMMHAFVRAMVRSEEQNAEPSSTSWEALLLNNYADLLGLQFKVHVLAR